jgi:hypothetical protein
MIFVELPAFTQQRLFDDDELRAIQARLLADPEVGDRMPGGHGLRKMRVGASGRGKRGGARVIYYWRVSQHVCYLVFAYTKNRVQNLTPTQTLALSAAVKEAISNG